MVDFRFTITKIHRAVRHDATRAAIFSTVFDDWAQRDLFDLLAELRGLWRRRLAQYEAAGVRPSSNRNWYSYYRNCPPFGVTADPRTRQCNRAIFCPFCWAREYVLKPFTYMETLLFGGTKPRAKLIVPKSTVIAATATTRRYTSRPGYEWEWDPYYCGLSIARAFNEITRSKSAHDYNRYQRGRGGFVLHTIEPVVGAIRFRRGTVLLLPDRLISDSNTQQYGDGAGESGLHFDATYHPPTRKGLAAAILGTCSYPAGMLDEDVPIRAITGLLTLARGHRMFLRRGKIGKLPD